MKKSKVARRKENGSQILLKNGFLEPKRKKLRMKKLKRFQDYLKKHNLKIIYKNGFESKMLKQWMTRGLKGGHAIRA